MHNKLNTKISLPTMANTKILIKISKQLIKLKLYINQKETEPPHCCGGGGCEAAAAAARTSNEAASVVGSSLWAGS